MYIVNLPVNSVTESVSATMACTNTNDTKQFKAFIQPVILSLACVSHAISAIAETDKNDNIRTGVLLYRQEDYAGAEKRFNKELSRSRTPARYTHALRVKYYLAKVKLKTNSEDGIKLMQEVLTEQKQRLGPDHPDTIMTLRTLSVKLKEPGQIKESNAYLTEALNGELRLFGEKHPRILRTKKLLQQSGAYSPSDSAKSDVEAFLQDPAVLEQFHTRQGEQALHNCEFEKAEKELIQAKKLVETNHGGDSISLISVLLMLGQVEQIRNRLDAAAADLQKTANLAKLHEEAASRAKALRLLALVKEEQSKGQEAAKLSEEAVEICKSQSLHEDLVDAATTLAMIKMRQKKEKDGSSALKQVISYLTGITADTRERQKLNNLTAMLYFKDAELALSSGTSYKQARSILDKGLSLLSNRRDYYRWSLEGELLDARFLTEDNKFDQAMQLLAHVEEPALALRDWDLLARVNVEKFRLWKKQGKNSEASAAASKALKYAKDTGNRFISPNL